MSDLSGKQPVINPSSTVDDEDSSWQVQTKPRRLGPQHSLSRQHQQQQQPPPPQQQQETQSALPSVEEPALKGPATDSGKKKGTVFF